jgi:hypothetical protein
MPNVILHSVVFFKMLSVIILNVVMINDVMLSDVVVSIVLQQESDIKCYAAYLVDPKCPSTECRYADCYYGKC